MAYKKIQITEQQSQLRDYLMNSVDSVFAFDSKTKKIVFQNKSARRLFGIMDNTEESITFFNEPVFNRISMDESGSLVDQDTSQHSIQQLLSEDTDPTTEFTLSF